MTDLISADHLKLTLYIANKNYSSWSLRPWIAMKTKNIVFTEHLLQFDEATGHAHFIEYSPTKKVPALKIEQEGAEPVIICESLAILEAIADIFPEAGLWPVDVMERARARAYAAEMHGGFFGLRGSCPMNIRREAKRLDLDPYSAAAVVKNVERIEQIWRECLDASVAPSCLALSGQWMPCLLRLSIALRNTSLPIAKCSMPTASPSKPCLPGRNGKKRL